MAWVSAALGAVSGLILAIFACYLGNWPVWLAVVLYPFVAALIAMCILALLYWRSTASETPDSALSHNPDKPLHRLRPDVL